MENREKDTSNNDVSSLKTIATQSSLDQIEIKEQQSGESRRSDLSCYDLFAIGICTAIGGHYVDWNKGLEGGFGNLMVTTFLVSTAYIGLVCCLAEMCSALPFAGGGYGVTRITLGIYPGYLVACFEAYESVLYIAAAALFSGDIINSIAGTDAKWELLYWSIYLIVALVVHSRGNGFFWLVNRVLCIVSLGLLLVYIFGCFQYVDFPQYLPHNDKQAWFHGGFPMFMRMLPLPAWSFMGIEFLNLSCEDIPNPKRNVPRGYISCTLTLIVTCFLAMIVCCGQAPGYAILKHEEFPLHFGFARLLHEPQNAGMGLALPAVMASGFGFLFASGRQLSAMGRSGLLPPALGVRDPQSGSPHYALRVSAVAAFVLGVASWLTPDNKEELLFNIASLTAVASYILHLLSFLVFRRYYSNIKRDWTSPLGIYGALYSLLVFSVIFVAICGFQKDEWAPLGFVAFLLAASVYYPLVVIARQTFSEDEKRILFSAYVIKSNQTKADRIRKGKAHTQNQALTCLEHVWDVLCVPHKSDRVHVGSIASGHSLSTTSNTNKPHGASAGGGSDNKHNGKHPGEGLKVSITSTTTNSTSAATTSDSVTMMLSSSEPGKRAGLTPRRRSNDTPTSGGGG